MNKICLIALLAIMVWAAEGKATANEKIDDVTTVQNMFDMMLGNEIDSNGLLII